LSRKEDQHAVTLEHSGKYIPDLLVSKSQTINKEKHVMSMLAAAECKVLPHTLLHVSSPNPAMTQQPSACVHEENTLAHGKHTMVLVIPQYFPTTVMNTLPTDT
jgi:hypothetical protein